MRAGLRLPDFVVIGAMKSGTTSLHHYLSLHPEVGMSATKEPTFFTAEGNWGKGTAWYADQFDPSRSVLGEASPDYTKFPRHSGVVERMHSLLPEARLVYLVRDPIARLISHYVDAYSFGRVHKPLHEALKTAEGRHYLACSRYFLQLEQYLERYEPSQILVVATEDLAADRESVLSEIFEFLGVDRNFSHPGFAQIHYTRAALRRRSRSTYPLVHLAARARRTGLGSRLPRGLMGSLRVLHDATGRPIADPELTPDLRETLAEQLGPDADKLRRLTGKAFSEWTV
jgi:hypothetical protein